jgi:hypothetical protein
MEDSLLRIPVVCPECGEELLTEFPAAVVAEALNRGDTIRLHASCDRRVWQASNLEREQLREYLEAVGCSLLAARHGQPDDWHKATIA